MSMSKGLSEPWTTADGPQLLLQNAEAIHANVVQTREKSERGRRLLTFGAFGLWSNSTILAM
jgi:hypothetical protein